MDRLLPRAGWSARTCTERRRSGMVKSTKISGAEFSVIGVDIGKNVFHLVTFDAEGKVAFRRKIKRLALQENFKRLPRCIVRHGSLPQRAFCQPQVARPWASAEDHPAIQVKPFVKGQKNGYNDAEAAL